MQFPSFAVASLCSPGSESMSASLSAMARTTNLPRSKSFLCFLRIFLVIDVNILAIFALWRVPLLVLVNEHLPVRCFIVLFLTSTFRALQSLADFENRDSHLLRLLSYLHLFLPRSLHRRLSAYTQTFPSFQNLDYALDYSRRNETEPSLLRS